MAAVCLAIQRGSPERWLQKRGKGSRMEADGFDRAFSNGDGSEDSNAGTTANSLRIARVAEERRKYIEDVDDLDLYMKIYPEVKRRRDEAERQVQLVEAEIKRREQLRFFAGRKKTFYSELLHTLRSFMRSIV